MNSRKTDNQAFTLLELLVAMSMMVVVAGCLYTILYTAFRARRSSEIVVKPSTVALNVLGIIGRDLIAAVPPTETLSGQFLGQDSIIGRADASDSMSFYTTNVDPTSSGSRGVGATIRTTTTSSTVTTVTGAFGGVIFVEYLLEESNDGDYYRLIRRTTGNLLAPGSVTSKDTVLCNDVTAFNLRYHDGYDWLDSWDETDHNDVLPLAVEVTLALAQTDERVSSSGSSSTAGTYNNNNRYILIRRTGRVRSLRLTTAFPVVRATPLEETTSTTSSSSSTSSTSSTGASTSSAGGRG